MEALLILFVIGLIGVILIGSILGLTSSGRMSKLETQNRNLNARLKVLEMAHGNGEASPRAAPKQPTKTAPPEPKPAPIPWHEREPVLEPEPSVAAPAPQPVAAATASAMKTAPDTPSWSPPESQAAKPKRNLEELIGGQWSVWVGGLALLVGAVLLIRFSIEAGFFGPTARIAMAFALGIALLLAGEWLKRSDDKVLKGRLGEAAKALQSNASVPGLLSAVGIFTLLGASYAAHALYGLIPALAAFMALAVISVGAMVLSLRQGPLLAAIGLLASFATPLLIQTETPSLLMLLIYLVLIGGAALVLSRRTNWGWLATGTVFGWLGWSILSVEAAMNGQLLLWSTFLALGFAVTVWFSDQYGDQKKIDLTQFDLQPILAILWGGLAALLVIHVASGFHDHVIGLPMPALFVSLFSIAALIGVSWFFPKQAAHLVSAGILALSTLFSLEQNLHFFIVMAFIVATVLLSFRQAGRGPMKMAWAVFAVGLGLVSVILLNVTQDIASAGKIHAAIAMGFVGLFASVSIGFHRKDEDWWVNAMPVIGAGLAWLLAALLAFNNLQLSLAVSLGAALTALVIWRLRLPGTRFVLLGLVGFVFAHAFLDQFPNADAISTRPIFNELWVYLALPTAILGAAAFVLHRRDSETDLGRFLSGIIEAAALAGLALFAVFQIRHLSNGGVVYADSLGHAELGLQLSIGLCFTLAGLSKRFAGNFVLSKIAEVISYATLIGFGVGSLFALSPLFDRGEDVSGNLIFNSLTTGLLVPTILLGLCAVFARRKRPETYINILGGLALAGALSWVTAMIRFMYNGPTIDVWSTDFGDLELWTISAVWLAFGILLLALGVWRREQALRIASGIVIILTVLKAFLIDMAGLEGVLRALSFVALGLILIVIGRAYQRYWLSDRTKVTDIEP